MFPSNLKKTELTSKSIGELKGNPELIRQVYEQLCDVKLNHLGPLSDPSNFQLPFNSNKRIRAAALRKRFEQRGLEISDLKYKSKFGYYKDEKTGVEFPFFFEIAVVRTTNLASNLYYIESLNSSVMPGRYHICVDLRELLNGKHKVRNIIIFQLVYSVYLSTMGIHMIRKNARNHALLSL